ncbi:DUF3313 domain-containing protein [Rhodoplanes sp. TEM]|uniref:DUF3313 domain-containing protein n=2 Tax=Nitrobacteraceae TaxID=41294 RepID=A0ABT5JCQ2_RHOTP|nr:DUF3313 domain-containing protein [Rhodoplanes tepidamans]MDC7787233.1 DUF3313 domain-containing protein [Rhodoplanes tepidamans]MDC7986578.1 DUF3313 domain-containing protein [Rhodoplanes sp. TEM]
MLLWLLAGCASAPLDRAGTLQSYDRLEPANGLVTRSLLEVSPDDVLVARTVKIVPTVFSDPAARTPLTAEQRRLVANAVDRALCAALSERFAVVRPSEHADLTVHAVVTQLTPTDPVAAGLSKGGSVAKSILLPGVPGPVPRIPVGLGSLSLEAEARDPAGRPQAAMVWGRGATVLFGPTRIAENGDAYVLAAEFGADFGKLLVTGRSPFGGLPSPPSLEKIGHLLGKAPKYPACEAFGRPPGLVGLLGEQVGAPPSWTDQGAAPAAAATE